MIFADFASGSRVASGSPVASVLGLAFVTFLGAGHFAQAAKRPLYDVTFSTTAAGREINAQHLTLEAGRPARLSQADAKGTVEIEIGAQPQPNGAIFIAASIFETARNGVRREIGRPQIIARAGEPAALEVGEKNKRTGRDEVQYQLRVLAKPKN